MALVGAAVVGVTALSLAKVNSIALNSMKANSTALQAYQFADAEAQIVRATDYSSLASKAKSDIPNSNGFQSEVTLSAESDYSDTIKQKTATVKIYRSGESTPRISLDVKKLSKEVQPAGGVPVGTIIAWPGSSAPTEGGTWLLCNGQSCVGYPALSAIVGSTVPNLEGRFLEGTTGTPRSLKDAGLPNITGNLCLRKSGEGIYSLSGVFAGSSASSNTYSGHNSITADSTININFMASNANGIYGKSSTVQPASYTVRYYIKAA